MPLCKVELGFGPTRTLISVRFCWRAWTRLRTFNLHASRRSPAHQNRATYEQYRSPAVSVGLEENSPNQT